MIVITKIEFFETDRDPAEIARNTHPYEYINVNTEQGAKEIVSQKITSEWISGNRFIRPSDGTDIVIGMSVQAQELIGIQYDSWLSMSNELSKYQTINEIKEKEIESAKRATLWTRIKWVLKGYYYENF